MYLGMLQYLDNTSVKSDKRIILSSFAETLGLINLKRIKRMSRTTLGSRSWLNWSERRHRPCAVRNVTSSLHLLPLTLHCMSSLSLSIN